MTQLALRNPIAILMLSIAALVLASVVTPRMSVDTFPELTPPVLVIGTLAPGLGPKDVEKTITWRLEKFVSSTPGVDYVQSVSRNNLSIIYVWLKWGTNLNGAQTLVQQQAAFAMAAVPKSLGVLPPFVLQYDPANAPVIQVAVRGKGYSGPQLYDYAFNTIEPLLEGIAGVASAAPDGGRQRQINVIVDPSRASARKMTAADVSHAVARSNALLPSGEFITEKFDTNVYTNAIPTDVATIGEAPVKVIRGRAVRIDDVADVSDGGSPPTQSVSLDGEEAVYLNVLRVPGGNTIQIVDAVKDVVAGLTNLPAGVQVEAFFDQSTFVRTTYAGLKREIFQALILIGLVILTFLQSLRATLIVSVAIPLSFAMTLILLYATGQTLNAFTLGGLTLAMGRLVDDAVVVLESIHHHQKRGIPVHQAALEGAQAVALPVLASTLTTIAVLFPVLLLEGLAQKLFAPLALTVAVAMIASYLVSMGVTPVACAYFLRQKNPSPIGTRLSKSIDRIAQGYANLLARVLPESKWILICSALLVLASIVGATRLPTSFFPDIDESINQVYLRFSPGTSLNQATKIMNQMARTLRQELPPHTVETIIANVGSPQSPRSALTSPNVGANTGFLRIAYTNAEKRVISQTELSQNVRAILDTSFPGVEVLQQPGGLVASVFANGYLAPLVVEVRGDNLERLASEARSVAAVARTVPGIRDVRVSVQMDYPEVRIEADRGKAGLMGVTLQDAAQSTLDATLGNINAPSTWIDAANGQSYYVVTAYDSRAVRDVEALSELPVRIGPQGAVTLGAYAAVKRSVGPTVVERSRHERAMHILMQLEKRDLGGAAAALEKALRHHPSTQTLSWDFVGQIGLMRKTFNSLGLALSLAVMMVFMIMASQFKSLKLPFVMLFTIPVALIGIVVALVAAGQGFSITALMGILMVIGIAVSNGILLVDDANRRHHEGVPQLPAIMQAARSRFVPIAMTSLATVIGLLPNAMGLERGSESNQPLALAVVGGLTSSTLLSLFLVPAVYLLVTSRPKLPPQNMSPT